MPNFCAVSLIAPLKSSLGARGRRNVSGLEGKGIPLMGRGKVSGTHVNLQDLLRRFCSTRVFQSGGRDFISSISQLNLCARGQDGTWCVERLWGQEWYLGALGFWHCPGVRDTAIVIIELQTAVGWSG